MFLKILLIYDANHISLYLLPSSPNDVQAWSY
nr:MAG TPA: hypothetical protein [Caudoviricetes sp.]